jgi:hypothetical protein
MTNGKIMDPKVFVIGIACTGCEQGIETLPSSLAAYPRILVGLGWPPYSLNYKD